MKYVYTALAVWTWLVLIIGKNIFDSSFFLRYDEPRSLGGAACP